MAFALMVHILLDKCLFFATNQEKFAYDLGMIAGKEAHAVGCNWSFAPIVDIDYNF